MLGEFADNSCLLLISPAQLTRTLIRVLLLWSQQVDIVGGKDDNVSFSMTFFYFKKSYIVLTHTLYFRMGVPFKCVLVL